MFAMQEMSGNVFTKVVHSNYRRMGIDKHGDARSVKGQPSRGGRTPWIPSTSVVENAKAA